MTYVDIYEDFIKRYPMFEGFVDGWHPAIEYYRNIIIQSCGRRYLYNYHTKALNPVGD